MGAVAHRGKGVVPVHQVEPPPGWVVVLLAVLPQPQQVLQHGVDDGHTTEVVVPHQVAGQRAEGAVTAVR